MSIVSAVMRQHRGMQRLHGAIVARPHDVEAIAAFGRAVVEHMVSTEIVLGRVDDALVAKDFAAHQAHHTELRLQLFRYATASHDGQSAQRAELVRAAREHALHEAMLLRDLLLALEDDQLEALGEQLVWAPR